MRERTPRNISERVPFAVHNERHDSPSLPGSYGSAGWTTGDSHFLVYDQFDIWAVDPTGRTAPRNITEGVGRRDNVRFRYVRLDTEERAIDPNADMLLSAFNVATKADGYYRDRVRGDQPPVRLIMDDKRFGTPRKAENADVLMLTRSDFREFPDVWVSDMNFSTMSKLSNANPQQADYRWGTAELVSWRSGQNEELQGVLYKPDDFDPTRKYPMMVYFYERLSDNLHGHFVPAPGGSSINISFYVSRGYLVFTPDIPYRIGYPGESAYNAVVPGVLSLLPRGYIDEQRIGVQGHSWGGYQIAYLVTKTDLFAAAEAGAPVVNMVSAYGGIRWESGMVRQFQYERTQSRLGGTLWDAPMRFIENSPIFWADKVNTPLLMMHNDEDGAVPWEQGIEYFVALRRLSKPVWMLNYNGEAHGLRRMANRKDWTVRMQQFFDHYLMDAPVPVWMEHGVPATEKGRDLGLDLVGRPVSN
jgi:acetyl esterase/lipase